MLTQDARSQPLLKKNQTLTKPLVSLTTVLKSFTKTVSTQNSIPTSSFPSTSLEGENIRLSITTQT